MKIAIIGGGSSYTPEVIDGFCNHWRDLGLKQVALYDIDAERVSIIADFGGRQARAAGAGFTVKSYKSLSAALGGADFILTQIRVGGQQARKRDIKLGLKHGLIGQETTGIGGFAKALRTIPEMQKICRAIEKHAPGAWMINFTNPSGLITEMILNHSEVRAIGLCNVPIDMQMQAAKYLGVDSSAVRLDYIGLNHLGWVRRIWVDGEDITERLLTFLASAEGPKNIPDVDYDPWLIESLKMIPLWYCRYYYYTERMMAELKAKKKTRAEEVMAVERELFRFYKNRKNETKPEALEKRGGAYYSKIAVDLIRAIASDSGAEHVVNIRNEGTISDLRDYNVIETPAKIGADGARPISRTDLEPEIRGLIQVVKAYEELAVKAAINRSWSAAMHALLTHPLGPTADRAEKILNELLKINGLKYS